MPRRKQCHTSAPPGKRMRVVMKNGETFVDKFRSTEKGSTYFDEHTVKTRDMQSMTIYNASMDRHRPEFIRNRKK